MRLFDYFWPEAVEDFAKAERQKRKIDRIAREAERQQRFAKGWNWK